MPKQTFPHLSAGPINVPFSDHCTPVCLPTRSTARLTDCLHVLCSLFLRFQLTRRQALVFCQVVVVDVVTADTAAVTAFDKGRQKDASAMMTERRNEISLSRERVDERASVGDSLSVLG